MLQQSIDNQKIKKEIMAIIPMKQLKPYRNCIPIPKYFICFTSDEVFNS